MKPLAPVVLSALVVLGGAFPASADAILYSNEAAFVAATGATLHTLPTGPGGSYLQATSITTTDSALTLTALGNNLFSNWEAYPGVGVSRLPGPDLAISSYEDLDVAVGLGGDRFAFGFGIYEPMGDATIKGCNAPCVESTFEIRFLKDSAPVGIVWSLQPSNNVPLFWGFHTDFAFNGVQVREVAGGIDNEILGTFYTGRTAIPEPATLLLTGVGLALTGVRRYRRRT